MATPPGDAIRNPAICAVSFHPDTGADRTAAMAPDVAAAYGVVRNDKGRVSPMYLAMSQTPGVIVPADQLYLAVLHDDACPIEPWQRELVSAHVARLAGSIYSATHHGANFRDFYMAADLGDATTAEAILAVLDEADAALHTNLATFDPATRAMLIYAAKLSRDPAACRPADLDALRQAGLDDAAISWLIQIVSAFAYFARMIHALGVELGNEPIGLKGWAEE